MSSEENKSLNFIEAMIEEDLKSGKHNGRIQTRFPPEPNGYLHIGHAKSICLNFGLAKKYNGKCNLRFDDTNPVKEDVEYVDSIKEDIRWLGFEWEDREYFASDYFDQLYEWAKLLVKKGLAYVDESSADEVAATRGTPTVPGKESPFRNRPVEENLDLLERMKSGEFPDGSRVLRAKIDMASPNMHMRDPVMYRIKHAHHHRTGNKWCIYPMYDFAHGQSDFIEGITHSLCTLEFEVHRPLYDWFLDNIIEDSDVNAKRTHQTEFARLNMNYTVMSKRLLLQLVKENHVDGWDDPRMPTISGLRRRGYTPESVRNFAERVGVAKRENTIDVGLLEHCVREDLNKSSQRIMGVINPLKVTIENYPEGKSEDLDAVNNPEDENMGTRKVPFSRNLFIEQDDFMEEPPKKFFRLAPGSEVRLRYAYFITCKKVVKNENGEVVELICTYDPESKGGNSPDGRKVKGTLHWVSAEHAVESEIRLYDRLFEKENPYDTKEGETFLDNMNKDSLKIVTGYIEPFIKDATMNHYQFERLGYFYRDRKITGEKPVFNRTATLRDSWAKIAKQ
ncbi:MAG: glutamine--tRNA ligase/YqeY domain fusion protein [Bacteroidales bacterium]|nr:glutamine--tRNA ligase/YqeY domain fusion protein [Bacteroidales bacterium]MBN2820331.1 glutamine--tRNA ligase/YqeY domain fusion protein [Bacteroidales bacterium]